MSDDALLSRGDIWRGRSALSLALDVVPTGFAALDRLLPGGGWPVGALTEILAEDEDAAALRMTMPALARLSHTPRWLAWIAPPHIPYAPALVDMGIDLSKVLLVRPRVHGDRLWALEQALRSGTCSAVLAWPGRLDGKALRRLQLAAETGRSWGLLFRPHRDRGRGSTAALRLHIRPFLDGISVQVLKCRGGWAEGSVELRFGDNPPADSA